MDYPELLPAVYQCLLYVLLISSMIRPLYFRHWKLTGDGNALQCNHLSGLSPVISCYTVCFACYLLFEFLNVRFYSVAITGTYSTGNILLCAITIGIALTCWIVCKVTNNMTQIYQLLTDIIIFIKLTRRRWSLQPLRLTFAYCGETDAAEEKPASKLRRENLLSTGNNWLLSRQWK